MFQKGNLTIFFNSKEILAELLKRIKASLKIVGCVAWCTHPRLLDALEDIDTRLVMTKHKANKWKRQIRVKLVGKPGRRGRLMHHKFIIGFSGKQPVWVATGSFNLTKSAMKNDENCMIIDDQDVAEAFYDEFVRLSR